MTKIHRISVHTHCNDLGGKVWNPAIKWTKKYAVFITVENEQGVTGIGECWCFDTSPDVLIAYLRTEICPLVIGTQPRECSQIYKQLLSRATLTARHGLLASAWSGVDIALWDLCSRSENLPLWKYILQTHTMNPGSGGESGQVKLYASGGLYGKDKSTADLVTEMQSMHASGFDIVKMKIGGLSISEDLERIKAVLNALDKSCKLIIDGVYSYTEVQAKEIFNALPANRIEAFQSPVKAEELSSIKTLTDTGVPVMAIEAEYRTEIHEQLIDTGALRYLQTAPVACGGINRLLELSERIQNTGIRLSLEVSSTAVALLAACHYAAASNMVAHVEYHYLHQVFFEHIDLNPDEGWISLPDKPGIGIELHNLETSFETHT